jgi:hypothetical protein
MMMLMIIYFYYSFCYNRMKVFYQPSSV